METPQPPPKKRARVDNIEQRVQTFMYGAKADEDEDEDDF